MSKLNAVDKNKSGRNISPVPRTSSGTCSTSVTNSSTTDTATTLRLDYLRASAFSFVPCPLSLSTEMSMALSSETSRFERYLKQLYTQIQEGVHHASEACHNITQRYNQAIMSDQHESSEVDSLCKQVCDSTEEEIMSIQKALGTIDEIRTVHKRLKLEARRGGLKESVRRGALMKMLEHAAQTLPLWTGVRLKKVISATAATDSATSRRSGAHREPQYETVLDMQSTVAPPLCGCVPAVSGYVSRVGDTVAACVRDSQSLQTQSLAVDAATQHIQSEAEVVTGGVDTSSVTTSGCWILAECVSYDSVTGRYELVDIDDETNLDSCGRGRSRDNIEADGENSESSRKIVLSRRKVIPLPCMRADPSLNPEALFPVGATVNAIYPQTTCFYKSIVKRRPQHALDQYEILFEDASYADGFAPPLRVAQRYVINYKQKRLRKD